VERVGLLDVEAEPTMNPTTRQQCAITSAAHLELLTEAGLTTWGPLDYLVLVMAGAVRLRAGSLLTPDLAEWLVRRLGGALPELVAAVEARVPAEVVTNTLRELLADGVPIRDLRRILQALLRYETDTETRDRWDDRSMCVRSTLADVIHQKLTSSANTLVVYIVDPALEQRFDMIDGRRTSPAQDDAVLALRQAVETEMRHLPRAVRRPAILVADNVRRAVRAAVRPQFPDLMVIGYGDLRAQDNLQPVARLQAP
jgi:type III secretory pathway component EscV